MQQLDEIVNYYLTSDTNHALMITGSWGTGKSYYLKNILKCKIENIPTFEDNSKNYKPVLISLFGLKSITEIQTEIFLSLYPILDNKKIKLSASIGKALIKGIMRLNSLDGFLNNASNIEINKEDWLKFSELVICFDDLERISNNLNLEELIGYINNLVENENVKVLIIANEDKIQSNNYHKLKEKVIGNSIEFIPDISNTFDSIIQIKFSSSPHYKQFLNKNKRLILEIHTKNSTNLRILSFALIYFQNIFSEVEDKILFHEVLNTKKDEILLLLLNFSLAISIEYKEGRTTFKKKRELYPEISYNSPNKLRLDNEKTKQDRTYREIFIDRYYPNNRYIFFTSVFNFITGGSTFKIDELLNELKEIYHVEKDEIPKHYIILNRLEYPEVFSMNDDTYRSLTKQMLEYSDNGLYDLSDYLKIFSFSARFENPLKYNLDKLEKRIIRGMKKGKPKYSFHNSLEFYLDIDENSPYTEALLRLRNVIIEFNNEIYSDLNEIEYMGLEDNCYNNFQEFHQELSKRNNKYSYVPIFKNFSVTKFYKFLSKTDGQSQWQVIQLWRRRYNNHSFFELKQEVDFLEELKNKLVRRQKKIPKSGLKSYIIKTHIRALQESIIGLKSS